MGTTNRETEMKYSELIKMSIEKVRIFLEEHPDHVGAKNALSTLEHDAKREAALKRMGRRHTAESMSKSGRFSHSGPRCPTKRELR